MNKIFEIGMPKTGTTSLGRAYEILGYRHKGWSAELHDLAYQGSDECGPDSPLGEGPGLERVLPVIHKYDAFEDGPWHNIDFRVLDQRFPDSKFILLERDDDSWFASMHYQFQVRYTRPWFDKHPDKAYWLSVKRQRHEAAKAYFRERPDDLLVMNLAEGDPWEPLCAFLGKPVPDVPFPRSNRQPKTRIGVTWARIDNFVRSSLARLGLAPGDPDAAKMD